MPRFLSEEAHEQWCDRMGLPEDAAPEPIEDEPTAPVEYCDVCGCPEDDGRPCLGRQP